MELTKDIQSMTTFTNDSDEASAEEGIRQGLEDLKAGNTRAASEVFAELRAAYDIPAVDSAANS